MQDYDAAAWLAQQIIMDYDSITSSNKTAMDQQIGDLQFALLAIFDSSLIPHIISSSWGDLMRTQISGTKRRSVSLILLESCQTWNS
jgi:hypothetical protein